MLETQDFSARGQNPTLAHRHIGTRPTCPYMQLRGTRGVPMVLMCLYDLSRSHQPRVSNKTCGLHANSFPVICFQKRGIQRGVVTTLLKHANSFAKRDFARSSAAIRSTVAIMSLKHNPTAHVTEGLHRVFTPSVSTQGYHPRLTRKVNTQG